jgi:hypothetical protein
MKKLLFIFAIFASFMSYTHPIGGKVYNVSTKNNKITCTLEILYPEQTYELLGIGRLKKMFSVATLPNNVLHNTSNEIPHILAYAKDTLAATKITITNKSSKSIEIKKNKFLKIDNKTNIFLSSDQILNLYPQPFIKKMVGLTKLLLGTAVSIGGICVAIEICNKNQQNRNRKMLEELKKTPLALLFMLTIFLPITLCAIALTTLAEIMLYGGIAIIPGSTISLWGMYDLYRLLKIKFIKNNIANSSKCVFLTHNEEIEYKTDDDYFTIPAKSTFHGLVFMDSRKMHSTSLETQTPELVYC